MSWCGYIDILGTKEMAANALDELRIHMDHFHGALMDNYGKYSSGTCVAASDGAFFQNPSFENFYPYYREVRNVLFDKGVFFKASYIEGRIKFHETRLKSGKRKNGPQFVSLNFGDNASEAFQAEARLKGIGCTVKKTEDTPLDDLITNFYVVKQGQKYVAEKFYDFRMSPYEVGSPRKLGEGDGYDENAEFQGEQRILETIFYHTSLAAMNSECIAAKYVPMMVNAIRSSDFTDVRVKDGSWVSAPYVLRRLVGADSAIKGFAKLPGIRYILLSIYDQLYLASQESISKEAEDKLVKFIAIRKDCQSSLGDIPSYVLGVRSKKAYIKALARLKGLNVRK